MGKDHAKNYYSRQRAEPRPRINTKWPYDPYYSGGGGSAYNAKTQAILDYANANTITIPSTERISKLDELITAWEPIGVFNGPCWVNWYESGLKEFSKINISNPATNFLSEIGTVTFTALAGVKSASSSYFNTGYSGDCRGSFCEVTEDGNTGQVPYGAILSASDRLVTLQTRDGANRIPGIAVHSNSSPAVGTGGSLLSDLHFYQLDLISGTEANVYLDGVLFNSPVAITEITPTALEVSYLARNFNGTRGSHFTRNVSCLRLGPVLGNAAAIKAAWDTYKS